MNTVILVGRVGQDPEIKYFESGKNKTTFSIAVNRWNAATKAQDTDWFRVEMWGKRAETAAEWVKKGALISVEGRIAVSRWQAPDGEQVETYLINASDFGFVGGKKDNQAVSV